MARCGPGAGAPFGQLGSGSNSARSVPAPVTGLPPIVAIATGTVHNLALQADGTVWGWGAHTVGQLADGTTTTRFVPVRAMLPDGTAATATAIAAGLNYSLSVGTFTLAAAVSPPVHFGTFPIGQTAAAKSVTLTNTGNADLALMRVELTGSQDFFITRQTCVPAPLVFVPAAGTCTVEIAFKPSAAGPASARALFHTDAQASPLAVDLTGEGNADATPPAVTIDASPAISAQGWYRAANLPSGAVSIAVTATDGGSGVQSIAYSAIGAEQQAGTVAPAPAGPATHSTTLNVGAEGVTTVSATAKDVAGNESAPSTLTVRIDRTAPTVAITFPQPGAIYPMGSPQRHTFTCQDALAGIVSCYTPSTGGEFIDTFTAGTKTFSVTATDLAGNISVATVEYFVASRSTTTVLTASPSVLVEGRPVGIRARVTNATGFAVVSGSVRIDELAAAGIPLRTLATLSIGQDGAVFTVIPTLSAGVHRLQAAYQGNAASDPSVSVEVVVTVAATPRGALRAWGSNSDGQIGNGEIGEKVPQPFSPLPSGVTASSGGTWHTVAATGDGRAWAWGRNDKGQLGIGAISPPQPAPVLIPGVSDVSQIAAGESHTLALVYGSVRAWGWNQVGQLGDGTKADRVAPVAINLANVRAVAAGIYHSVALMNDGTMRAWGLNGFGSLGDGTAIERDLPVVVPGMNGVVSIAASFHNTMALKADGTVWNWGNNQWGQAGNGGTSFTVLTPIQVSGLSNVIAVAAGQTHRLVLRDDGTVWAWGTNNGGQLAVGTHMPSYVPIQVPGLTDIVAIAAGSDTSFAIAADGTMWGWGWNVFGQLAMPVSETSSSVPVRLAVPAGVGTIVPGVIHILGIGPAPLTGVAPASLAFGDQVRTTQGTPQRVTIVNRGNAALHVTSAEVTFNTSDYIIVADECSGRTFEAVADATCTIDIAFRPGSLGVRNAFLVVTDDAPNSPHSIPLTGTGVDPNRAPVAAASATPEPAEATSPAGAVVALDASASSDPDGDPLTYRWTEGATTLATTASANVVLSIGTHVLTVTVEDGRGGAASATVSVRVTDTIAPTVTISSPIQGAIYQTGSPERHAFTCQDSGAGIASCYTPSTGGELFDTFTSGTKTFSVTATDWAGNRTTEAITYTVNTAPTAVAGATPNPAEATSPAGGDVSLSAAGSSDVDGSIVSYQWLESGVQIATGSSAPVYPSIGTHTFELVVADNAGAISRATVTVTVRDTTAPVIGGMPAAISKEATGPAGAEAAWTAPTATDLVDGALTVACDRTSGSTFALGLTTVTCSVADRVGNGASASFTVTVGDSSPPQLLPPPPFAQGVEATRPDGAQINYTIFATDTVSGPVPAACVPASGTVFPIGVTTISCTATDAAGNRGTLSFPYTVRDTTAPVFTTVPSGDVVITSSPFRFGAIGATDAVGVVSVTMNGVAATQPNPGGFWFADVPVTLPVAPGGALTFTVIARDAAGNARTQNVIVDNDGISGAIDRNRATGAFESTRFSSDFLSVSASGSTSGSIVTRAGHTVGVHPTSFGVIAAVVGPGGVAVISACSAPKEVWLDRDGETVDIRCAATGTVRVQAITALPWIEVRKLVTAFVGGCNRRPVQYWTVTSLGPGQSISTGSPLAADPENTEPLTVTLLQVDDDGIETVIGTVVLDPGESADVQFLEGVDGQDDRAEIVGLAGDVVVTITGTTLTVLAGETRMPVVDKTAPVIASVTPSVPVLWAPNHKMVVETIAVVAADFVDAAPVCRITGVTSNESSEGEVDWIITGDLSLLLRASRLGTASGRLYTVTVTCTDAAGNTSTATTVVVVPHDQAS